MLITIGELRRMNGQEGLILQGCGGNEQQWVDGINELFTLKDILLDGTTFKDVKSFCHEGLSNLLFSFEAVKLDMGNWPHGEFRAMRCSEAPGCQIMFQTVWEVLLMI